MILYHVTSPKAARLILARGFQDGVTAGTGYGLTGVWLSGSPHPQENPRGWSREVPDFAVVGIELDLLYHQIVKYMVRP